jgi:hypothetical protein
VKDLYISFTVGEVAGAVVGLVGYSTPVSTMDVCTWGHVVTQADQTGKGIATELTRASIEDFRSLSSKGSRAMFLSTGAKGAPRRVYEKCGMTAYGIVGRSAAMWLAMGDPAAFESDYYGDPGSLSMTDLKISDLPRVEALMSLPHWTVKSWTDGANGLRAFEGQFHELWRRTEAGLPCRVLRGSGERVFGIAWLSESDAGRALDVVAHPSVENMAVRLVQTNFGAACWLRRDSQRKGCWRNRWSWES